LSVVFLGTSQFAADVLERLAREQAHRPALVVTRPDRPAGRGRRLASPPVAELARRLEIPLAQPQSVNDEETRALIAQAGRASVLPGETGPSEAATEDDPIPVHDPRAFNPQTIVVCAFGALVREPLLSEHELLNVHPSLLPRWRGAAPIERAIMAGDAQTGVSIMRLTAGLDSGPVCLTASEPILSGDTYGSLAPRLSRLGGKLLVRALRETPSFAEQPSEGVTYAEKIGPEDRLLDPTRPAAELERVVRALHPHIGARVALADGALLGVHRAALLSQEATVEERIDLGTEGQSATGLAVRDGRLLLDCAAGTLELLEVQPPGGRAMDASAYLRGHGPPGGQ
jgi:methionyl-tRNA formyltransferase